MGVRLTITWRDDPRLNDIMRDKLLIAAEKHGLLSNVVTPPSAYSFRIQVVTVPSPPHDVKLMVKRRFEKFISRLRDHELPLGIGSHISDFTG